MVSDEEILCSCREYKREIWNTTIYSKCARCRSIQAKLNRAKDNVLYVVSEIKKARAEGAREEREAVLNEVEKVIFGMMRDFKSAGLHKEGDMMYSVRAEIEKLRKEGESK